MWEFILRNSECLSENKQCYVLSHYIGKVIKRQGTVIMKVNYHYNNIWSVIDCIYLA